MMTILYLRISLLLLRLARGAGACDYCHSTGTGPWDPDTDTATGILVYNNSMTHHFIGLGNDNVKCEWCHDMALSDEYKIRQCEVCHGFESLHNIQVDSDGDGIINPGVELPFYGHIGNPDDCWGCHGYTSSSEPATGSGPVIPYINSSDVSVVTAGTNTALTLSGSAFTNLDEGFEWLSLIVLTATDGSTTSLTPDSISEDSLTVTIPETVVTGNYALRAIKNSSESNPVTISVKPAVTITEVKCRERRERLIIRGSGFSEKIEGTDDYINVLVNGKMVDIIAWKDDRIKASVSGCSTDTEVKVNTLFGTATSGDNKPPKPCKGRECN
jgi:hypothetical protein